MVGSDRTRISMARLCFSPARKAVPGSREGNHGFCEGTKEERFAFDGSKIPANYYLSKAFVRLRTNTCGLLRILYVLVMKI